MSQTLHHREASLARADWFRAKLQCELGPVELKRLVDQKDSLVIIDVRDAESFAREHIPGAVNVPQSELIKSLSTLPKDKTLICYCWSATCFMAAKACLDLAQRDFNVLELLGGIKAWKDAEFPVEGDAPKPKGSA
jgi:rhodanese-related sulfurtransferase